MSTTTFALVTGASAGLGLALAEALARRGRNLILVARQRQSLEAIANELQQRFKVEVHFYTCDLTQPLQVSSLLIELERSHYRIDLLINNAGVGSFGVFTAQDWSSEQQLLELNIIALARLSHAIGRHMQEQGGGQILNVSSIAAFQPGPWASTYYASKAFVLSFSEGLREELKSKGIRVSVLCPGPTRTNFFNNAGIEVSSTLEKACISSESVAQIALRGLDRNQAIITPNWRNKLLAQAPRFTPRVLVRRITAYLNRHMIDLDRQ